MPRAGGLGLHQHRRPQEHVVDLGARHPVLELHRGEDVLAQPGQSVHRSIEHLEEERRDDLVDVFVNADAPEQKAVLLFLELLFKRVHETENRDDHPGPTPVEFLHEQPRGNDSLAVIVSVQILIAQLALNAQPIVQIGGIVARGQLDGFDGRVRVPAH